MIKQSKKKLFENSILNTNVSKYIEKYPERQVFNRRDQHGLLFTKTQIKEEFNKGNCSLDEFEIFGYMYQHFLGYEYLVFIKKNEPDEVKENLFKELCLPMSEVKKLKKELENAY